MQFVQDRTIPLAIPENSKSIEARVLSYLEKLSPRRSIPGKEHCNDTWTRTHPSSRDNGGKKFEDNFVPVGSACCKV